MRTRLRAQTHTYTRTQAPDETTNNKHAAKKSTLPAAPLTRTRLARASHTS